MKVQDLIKTKRPQPRLYEAKVETVYGVKIFFNPTKSDIRTITEKYGALRGTGFQNYLMVANADEASHQFLKQVLHAVLIEEGINYDAHKGYDVFVVEPGHVTGTTEWDSKNPEAPSKFTNGHVEIGVSVKLRDISEGDALSSRGFKRAFGDVEGLSKDYWMHGSVRESILKEAKVFEIRNKKVYLNPVKSDIKNLVDKHGELRGTGYKGHLIVVDAYKAEHGFLHDVMEDLMIDKDIPFNVHKIYDVYIIDPKLPVNEPYWYRSDITDDAPVKFTNGHVEIGLSINDSDPSHEFTRAFGKVQSIPIDTWEKRTLGETLNEVKLIKTPIDELKFFANPTRKEFEKLLDNFEDMRGILDQEGNVYWWDAYVVDHYHGLSLLGDIIGYDSLKGYESLVAAKQRHKYSAMKNYGEFYLEKDDPSKDFPRKFKWLMKLDHPVKETYVTTDSGNTYYGKKGSGALIMSTETGRILIPQRSEDVEEPSTWGTWGGAIDPGEDPKEAAFREIQEEAGLRVKKLIPLYKYEDDDFRYYTYLGLVEKERKPRINWETQNYRWVEFGNWPNPLHFGLKEVLNDSEAIDILEEYSQFFGE